MSARAASPSAPLRTFCLDIWLSWYPPRAIWAIWPRRRGAVEIQYGSPALKWVSGTCHPQSNGQACGSGYFGRPGWHRLFSPIFAHLFVYYPPHVVVFASGRSLDFTIYTVLTARLRGSGLVWSCPQPSSHCGFLLPTSWTLLCCAKLGTYFPPL